MPGNGKCALVFARNDGHDLRGAAHRLPKAISKNMHHARQPGKMLPAGRHLGAGKLCKHKAAPGNVDRGQGRGKNKRAHGINQVFPQG